MNDNCKIKISDVPDAYETGKTKEKKNLLFIGDILVCFSVGKNNNGNFFVDFSGRDYYVASELAKRYNVYFFSKLPLNDLGNFAVQAMEEKGINTSLIKRGGNQMGTYYRFNDDSGFCDNQKSSFACAKTYEFSYDETLDGIDMVYVDLATAELTYKTLMFTLKVFKKARERHIKTILDLRNDGLLDLNIVRLNAERLLKLTDCIVGRISDYKDYLYFSDDLKEDAYKRLLTGKYGFTEIYIEEDYYNTVNIL